MGCPQQIKLPLIILWALALVLGCVRNHLVSEACCRTALKSIFSKIELKPQINLRKDVKLPRTLIKNYGTKHGTVLRWIPTLKYRNILRSPSRIKIPSRKERNIIWNINWNVYVGFYQDLKRNIIFSPEQPRNPMRISLCFWSLGKRICLRGRLLNSQHAIEIIICKFRKNLSLLCCLCHPLLKSLPEDLQLLTGSCPLPHSQRPTAANRPIYQETNVRTWTKTAVGKMEGLILKNTRYHPNSIHPFKMIKQVLNVSWEWQRWIFEGTCSTPPVLLPRYPAHCGSGALFRPRRGQRDLGDRSQCVKHLGTITGGYWAAGRFVPYICSFIPFKKEQRSTELLTTCVRRVAAELILGFPCDRDFSQLTYKVNVSSTPCVGCSAT